MVTNPLPSPSGPDTQPGGTEDWNKNGREIGIKLRERGTPPP